MAMILVAEGLGVLNLVKEIIMKISNITLGEIAVYANNKQIFNGINGKIRKESQCIVEASATIEVIKKEIANAIIKIRIEYSNGNPRLNQTFQ